LSSGATMWLVRETFQMVKVSSLGGELGVGRSVVTTRAAS
jgi:hypothetical protein